MKLNAALRHMSGPRNQLLPRVAGCDHPGPQVSVAGPYAECEASKSYVER